MHPQTSVPFDIALVVGDHTGTRHAIDVTLVRAEVSGVQVT